MDEFTFDEKVVVASAISFRIHGLTKIIDDCLPLGIDVRSLCEFRSSLMSVYKKLTGVEHSVNH